MSVATILVPTRRNTSLESILEKSENFLIDFRTDDGIVLCELQIDSSNDSFDVFEYWSKYTSITKLIDRSIKPSLSLKEAEKFFYTLQKRIKGHYKLESQEETIIKEEPKKEEMKVVKEQVQEVKSVKIERPKAVGLEGQLQDIVFNVLESEFTTQTLQNKMLELGLEPNRTEITVKKFDGTKTTVTDQHYKFEQILQCVSAKVNIALVGPAGSGKTTVVRNVAKSLDLPFYSKSVSAQTGTHEFFGYQDANGNYVRTLFREAYENGGVFLLDEFDAGNPNVLASMNQATANGECAFADGMIKKHEDFIVVMAGNTFGHGATTEYVGRNKIDSATLDRFAFIEFDYDENLELKLSTNKEWCKKVQEIRAKVVAKKIKTIVSPRATFMGQDLLKAGMPMKTVLEVVIYKGLTQGEIKLLS
tara:strand:+ start:3552 stop:4808 length:1257 start_codon:yes stop_codon:yes gene_type:complete